MASCHMSIVTLDDGRIVCLSYSTPVAAHIPGVGYVRTDRKYSVTSSRHANQFCQGEPCQTIPHDRFLDLVSPVSARYEYDGKGANRG